MTSFTVTIGATVQVRVDDEWCEAMVTGAQMVTGGIEVRVFLTDFGAYATVGPDDIRTSE